MPDTRALRQFDPIYLAERKYWCNLFSRDPNYGSRSPFATNYWHKRGSNDSPAKSTKKEYQTFPGFSEGGQTGRKSSSARESSSIKETLKGAKPNCKALIVKRDYWRQILIEI